MDVDVRSDIEVDGRRYFGKIEVVDDKILADWYAQQAARMHPDERSRYIGLGPFKVVLRRIS
jgi:hypothetical protein